MLETDGHFREKLQAANAEDIKVWLGARAQGGEVRSEGRVQKKTEFPQGRLSSRHKTKTGEKWLLGVTRLGGDLGKRETCG